MQFQHALSLPLLPRFGPIKFWLYHSKIESIFKIDNVQEVFAQDPFGVRLIQSEQDKADGDHDGEVTAMTRTRRQG